MPEITDAIKNYVYNKVFGAFEEKSLQGSLSAQNPKLC